MTRKCILCKETNYKTKHSFFSAPKDAETRKKWKDAIGIPNYTVSAETYVCSKHFSDRDIISHWASGTPPHVVTIKYKKCRLRPGAVPTAHEIKKKSNLSTKNKNNQQDDDDDDDAVDDENEITERKTDDDNNDDDEEEGEEEEEEYDFEVNRGFETKKPTFAKHTKKKSFLIPRTYMNNDNNKLKLNNQPVNEQNNEFHDLKNKTFTSQHHRNFDGDNCEEEMIISEQLDNNLDDNDNDNDDDGNNENQDGPTYYMKTENSQQLYYVKTIDENSETNFTENDVVNDDNLNEKTAETYPLIDENIDYNNINSYEYPQSHDDDDNDDEIIEVIEQDIDDGDNMAIWEHIKTEKNNLSSNNNGHNVETPMESHTSADPLKLNDAYDDDDDDDEEVMLFEDLLDNYTEVMLPKGWSSLVESKGHDTSIIYAFMKTSMNGIPWIQKQVFIQSDMLMRCSAAGKELNPKIHNLIKEKKRVKVHSVDDVTDLLKEFDSRTICQGTFENISPAHMDNSVGYRDGINWRHVKCPLIINNGKTRCTKCSSLNIIAKRKKSKLPQAAESAELLDKERQIFILQKLLKEKTSRNDDKYNEKKMMINNHQSMLKFLDNIDIPNVQKVMIKECLKVPLFKDTTIEHSESWIFLSLRIYMESQRIYKYLLHNKYIKLPSVKIMKRYFNQIKTDIQFYKLFKKSIEKYGYSEEQLGEPS